MRTIQGRPLTQLVFKTKATLVIFMAIIFCIPQSCAPVFSELQSARTVGKNNIELTPSYSTVSMTEDNMTEGVQNHIGVQAAFGLSNDVDIRARYERIWLKDSESSGGVDIIGIGGKFSLLKDRISFYLPVGRAIGEDTKDSWEIQPTVFLTQPAIANKLEFTLAPKYIFTLCEECDDFVAVNLGAAFSDNLNKWAIRPEYGRLYNPGEEGSFGQFSIGVSFVIGNNMRELD